MTRRVLPPLLGLLALASCVQAWCVASATTPALDCVRYVGAAQQIEQLGWLAALRANPEQPCFPTLVWATHSALRATGWTGPWGVAAQIAAAMALVLGVVPAYFFVRRVAGSAAALIGGCAFATLPGLARLGADGLSDAWQMLWLASATACATSALARSRRPIGRTDLLGLACAGLCSSLALLTRAESLVFPPACLIAIAWRCRKSTAWAGAEETTGPSCPRGNEWRALACGAGSYCLGCGVPLLIFFVLAGAVSPADVLTRLTGSRAADQAQPLNAPAVLVWPLTEKQARRLFAAAGPAPLTFGRKDHSVSERSSSLGAAGRDYAREFAGALHPLLIAGLLSWTLSARRRALRPSTLLPLVAVGLLALLLAWLTLARGYVSLRHFLPAVLWSLPFAASGLHRLGLRLAALADIRHFPSTARISAGSWCAICCLAVCLPAAFRPVHASRAPHRAAAEYLAKYAPAGARVLDTRGWTALLDDLPTYGGEAAWAALLDPQLQFVVLEEGELHAATPRGESFRRLLTECGEQAAVCAPEARAGATVFVYRFDRVRWVGRWPALAALAPTVLPSESVVR